MTPMMQRMNNWIMQKANALRDFLIISHLQEGEVLEMQVHGGFETSLLISCIGFALCNEHDFLKFIDINGFGITYKEWENMGDG